MAAIDKIYANKKDAEVIVQFLNEHRDEIKKRCGCDPMKYVYSIKNWSDWNEHNKDEYNPNKGHPVTNFPESIDVCLAQMDNLPQPLIDGLLWCYDGRWLKEMRNAKDKGGKYDFEPWNYEVATRFVLDFKKYKFDDKNHNKLCLGRDRVFVNAYYFGKENTWKDGTVLWFTEKWRNKSTIVTGWFCDELDLHHPDCDSYTSCASLKIKTMKSLIRWVRKMNFPKGTTLKCSTGWVGGDFEIHCK